MKRFLLTLTMVSAVALTAFPAGEVIIRQDQGRNAFVDRKFSLLPNQALGSGETYPTLKAINVPISFKYTVTAADIAALGASTAANKLLTTLPARAVVLTTTVKPLVAMASNVASTGTLTSDNTNVANTETVTIGAKVYTFKTALTPTEGEVLIGADADASLLNLIRAINHGATDGTNYKAAAANANVSAATAVTSHAFLLTAKAVGVAGQVATTETSAHLAFGAATLTGGQLLSAATARVITANHNFGTAYDVLQAVGDTVLDFYATPQSENFAATTPMSLRMTSTGANLSTVTTGTMEVWVTYLVRPGS